jgi:hypothetical protein
MAVPKLVVEVACAANLFGSYLEHTIDPGGRLCTHKQLNYSVKRTAENHVTTASERNIGTSMRASNRLQGAFFETLLKLKRQSSLETV